LNVKGESDEAVGKKAKKLLKKDKKQQTKMKKKEEKLNELSSNVGGTLKYIGVVSWRWLE
jgi:hypothetical protein